MCTSDFSCTINEGNNFESVFVIAHEMGHNLGMNHDGERTEGNTCSPDRFLMSPVLGPGKVTWSTCSDQELTGFLTGAATKAQASCLEDTPDLRDSYNFNPSGKAPGELFSALDQCRLAFGGAFRPHLRPESPFEDLCRELWCSNLTHALRAHPALEGTDCSSKPFPYGSACREGLCLPFVPESVGANGLTSFSTSSPDIGVAEKSDIAGTEDCPAWFDPIFTQIFSRLRAKFVAVNPLLSSMSVRPEGRGFGSGYLMNDADQPIDTGKSEVSTDQPISGGGGGGGGGEGAAEHVWQLALQDCPVECGGGWAGVYHTCQQARGRGGLVDVSHCELLPAPAPSSLLERVPCATRPCNLTLNL